MCGSLALLLPTLTPVKFVVYPWVATVTQGCTASLEGASTRNARSLARGSEGVGVAPVVRHTEALTLRDRPSLEDTHPLRGLCVYGALCIGCMGALQGGTRAHQCTPLPVRAPVHRVLLLLLLLLLVVVVVVGGGRKPRPRMVVSAGV